MDYRLTVPNDNGHFSISTGACSDPANYKSQSKLPENKTIKEWNSFKKLAVTKLTAIKI